MNIWTGLLFLEGAIADAPLASELSADDTPVSPRTATADADSRPAPSAAAAAH
ncbi:hypothetical protein ACFPOA_12205 [Lysobacter niabensis]|uniref:hypothetical protein n=1 Tax=Agrilutibacter niabensis TaxID=380628 RepID=UPI003609BA3C